MAKVSNETRLVVELLKAKAQERKTRLETDVKSSQGEETIRATHEMRGIDWLLQQLYFILLDLERK